MSKKIWSYILLPIIILNLIPVCIFSAAFALAYQRNVNTQRVDTTQPLFWLYVAIFVINWGLVIFVFQKFGREGKSVPKLIAADGNLFGFNWIPTLILFLTFNAIWVIYVLAYTGIAGQWPSYGGLQVWQKIIFITLFPISAGFTEELFWRGFIINQLEVVGQTSWRATLFSAIGFSLVHGIFFPDKLVATFLIGLIAGNYYTHERKLLPLMLTHIFMDTWSYGLSLFTA